MTANVEEQKRDFAAALLHCNNDAFKAAFAICGNNMGFALQISQKWSNDPVVLAEKERLLGSDGARTFLPTKEQQARDIYTMATDTNQTVEDRVKAHKLYAEIMGFIEKPSASGTVNVLNQGVMVVRDSGSDADWQEKAIAHQRKLTASDAVN